MEAEQVLTGERLVLRQTTVDDEQAMRTIRGAPEVSRWWDDTNDDEANWWLSSAEATRLAVLVGDQVIGMIQWYENHDPEFRHAGIDIFLDPRHHGQGFGREAVTLLLHYLLDDQQHHRIVIDPAAANTRAIDCYRSCGFQDVGTMRFYQHHRTSDTWYDGLLMEYVVDPRPSG